MKKIFNKIKFLPKHAFVWKEQGELQQTITTNNKLSKLTQPFSTKIEFGKKSIELKSISPDLFSLEGELQLRAINDLYQKAKAMFDFSRSFTIDCANLSYCDSAGLALLLEWIKLAKQHQTVISFTNLQKNVLNWLKLMNLSSLFYITDKDKSEGSLTKLKQQLSTKVEIENQYF